MSGANGHNSIHYNYIIIDDFKRKLLFTYNYVHSYLYTERKGPS
jgi:hypothetical protein